MHVVVNHLRLAEPLPAGSFAAVEHTLPAMLAAGSLGVHLVRVDDLHLILVLFFASAEDADRIARDVGGPLMREHVVPYLAGSTDRSLGEVVVSSES